MYERFIEEIGLGKGYLVRLLPGDDFFGTTAELLREKALERGAFLSAIGSLVSVSYRNLRRGADLPITLNKTVLGEAAGPFELLSLEGTFVPMEGEIRYNVHVMLGTEDASVIGGHLLGATVYTTVEMVIVELGGSRVVKAISDQTGLTEMEV